MLEKELLLQEIEKLKKRLMQCSKEPRPKKPRIPSYKSPNYVVNYDALTKVRGGFVHPDILTMYN